MTRRTFESLGPYKFTREERDKIDKLLASAKPPKPKPAPTGKQEEIPRETYTNGGRPETTPTP